MVVEGVVLLRVEHLEQRRRRVAAEVHRHLVDFVEQEDGIARAGLLEALDDLARQRADVGAAVAADLGLVAHAAQRDAHEVAAGGARDRLAERGLADARRADEAQDRALHALDQRLHGEVLEDALLRLLEPVVILVEHALGLGDVVVLFLVVLPGQRDHPVDVVADDGRLGAHRRHHLELLDLLLGPRARLLGHLLGLELLLELLDLVLELVALAELLLDRAHLLVEVVLLLRALHLLLDAAADLALDLEHLDLGLHQAVDVLEPLRGRERLEQLLALLELEVQVRDDRVGEPARLGHGDHGVQRLRRHLLVELDVVLERRVHGAHERLALDRAARVVGQRLVLAREERLVGHEAADPRARLPSTSTFTVPSGRRSSWMIVPSVPTS